MTTPLMAPRNVVIAMATSDGQDERQRRQVGEELARVRLSIWSIEADTTAARPTMRPPDRSTPREMSTMPAPSATRMPRRGVLEDVADAVRGDEVRVVDGDGDDERDQHDEDGVGGDPVADRCPGRPAGRQPRRSSASKAVSVELMPLRHRVTATSGSSSGMSVARRMIGRLVGVRAVHDAGQPAATHDDDAIGLADQLRQLRRDHDDALPLCGELVDDRVDLELGAHVDAPRGLVEDEDLGVREQPAANSTFCWLPPERLVSGVWSDGVRTRSRPSTRRASRRARFVSTMPSRFAYLGMCARITFSKTERVGHHAASRGGPR